MTLAAQIIADVDDVFLQEDDFAQTILRYVGGDSGNIRQIVGVVTIHAAQVDDMRGRGYIHKGEIFVNEETVIMPKEAVLYGEKRYEVESVTDAMHGMKTVHIVRYESEHAGRQPVKGL